MQIININAKTFETMGHWLIPKSAIRPITDRKNDIYL